MKIIDINKEQFLNFLLNSNPFSQGQFGIMTLINGKLYKIYYKDFIETYLTRDESKLDIEVDSWLEIEKITNFGLRNPYKRLKELHKLLKTNSCNLVTGILSYNGLLVGIEMNYYEGYISLEAASKIILQDELDTYLNKCLNLINDLMTHNIVPKDIKEDNILVNPITGDVVLIDLDGTETTYGPDNYVNDNPYNKKIVKEKFNEMVNRLNNQSKNILKKKSNVNYK